MNDDWLDIVAEEALGIHRAQPVGTPVDGHLPIVDPRQPSGREDAFFCHWAMA